MHVKSADLVEKCFHKNYFPLYEKGLIISSLYSAELKKEFLNELKTLTINS